MAGAKATITYTDFLKLDLRTAKVLEASDHPNADKLIVLRIDLGEGEERQIIAGLKGHYDAQDLVGKQIVVVNNLEPRKMRGLESNGMLLAAVTDGQQEIAVLSPDKDVPPGTEVS